MMGHLITARAFDTRQWRIKAAPKHEGEDAC
jgi:hypothetical protein